MPPGRPRGPKYEENKRKTDRKLAAKKRREEERLALGLPLEVRSKQKPPTSLVLAKPKSVYQSKFDRAAVSFLRRANEFATKEGATVTVLVLPNDSSELPRLYSSNQEAEANFRAFEAIRQSMRPDSVNPLLASTAMHLIGEMEPLRALTAQFIEEQSANMFELPAEFLEQQPFDEQAMPSQEVIVTQTKTVIEQTQIKYRVHPFNVPKIKV